MHYLFKSFYTLVNGSGQPNKRLGITAKVMKSSIHTAHLARLQHAVLECVKIKPDIIMNNVISKQELS